MLKIKTKINLKQTLNSFVCASLADIKVNTIDGLIAAKSGRRKWQKKEEQEIIEKLYEFHCSVTATSFQSYPK